MEEDFKELLAIFKRHREWLAIDSTGKSFALQNDEIELEFERGKLIFGFLSDKGFAGFRIASWKKENQKLTLFLIKNFGRENLKMEFVPRVSATEFSEAIELARLEKASKIAAAIVAHESKLKLTKVSLNQENGRLATVTFQNPNGKSFAAVADVSDSLTADFLLSTAILLFEKLSARKKNPISKIWIIAGKKQSKNLQKLFALITENWRENFSLKEISKAENSQQVELKDVEHIRLESLWRGKVGDPKIAEQKTLSRTAQSITESAPLEIEAIFSKHGETLRFNGLPFARIRKVLNEEKLWFGAENKLQLLHGKNYADFVKLIEELKIYRRFDSPNRRHFFYNHAPESWLESILRRNIKLLDANLILAPLHSQFRAERDKIDLLAIRRDGRLVIIEIKTASDREMIFQAADYWRKIEKERRLGNLQKAKIFGEMKIRDESPLVYLVAPMLSFHRDFEFLAQTIIPEIEFYKFVLNENWKEKVQGSVFRV